MSGWIYILAMIVVVWSVFRLFAAEREVRVTQMEVERLHELALARREKKRAEQGHRQ